METSFQLPDPAWMNARSASGSGSAAPPLSRPLSPEGSSPDGGDAAKVSGAPRRPTDPLHDSLPAPDTAPLAATPAAGRRRSEEGPAPQRPQPGGLTSAIARDLVAKLAAGTAPHRPRGRSLKAQKAANRCKPKVRRLMMAPVSHQLAGLAVMACTRVGLPTYRSCCCANESTCVCLVVQVQGKIDENESQVAEMEEEIESLRLSNGKLENRNDLLVRRAWLHRQLRPVNLPQAVMSGSMTLQTQCSAWSS